jgi:hypothetical protein
MASFTAMRVSQVPLSSMDMKMVILGHHLFSDIVYRKMLYLLPPRALYLKEIP